MEDKLNNIPQNWSELTFRDKVAYIVTCAAFTVGTALSIVGLVVPPVGEVHPSVITLVGLFLSFCGALLGISHHFENELEKFKNETLASLNQLNQKNDKKHEVL